jgi:beta-glucosidase
MLQFPKDFLWGAALSAYQSEGENTNCDWWEWEIKAGLKEHSGAACRHYEFFRQDFDLAKALGHNAHRFSLEWSRIQPGPQDFSPTQLDHYREVVQALRQRGLEPVATLLHFTHPLWFTRAGGWLKRDAADYFLKYTEYVVSALAEQVRFWVTINEPMIYAYLAYLTGDWPPQVCSFRQAAKVAERLLEAHIQACQLIKKLYRQKGLAAPLISLAKNVRAFVPAGNSLRNRLAAFLRDSYFNLRPLEKLIRARSLDFIGLNYYSRDLIDLSGWGKKNIFFEVSSGSRSPLKKNSLGWDIYPQGLYELLLRFKKYGLPVFILENGICTDDDALRWEFIREHLKSVHQAMQQGLEVLGYLYWSLLDNFEWDKGFAPRFGLIEVDYRDYSRKPRESARRFAEVCLSGSLET